MPGCPGALPGEPSHRAGESRFEILSLDHHIDHAVFHEELGALEPFGQLLPNRLLDDARTSKSNERVWLSDDHIAEHGE